MFTSLNTLCIYKDSAYQEQKHHTLLPEVNVLIGEQCKQDA